MPFIEWYAYNRGQQARTPTDLATARAIADVGGMIDPKTEKTVDSAEVSATAGLVIARKPG